MSGSAPTPPAPPAAELDYIRLDKYRFVETYFVYVCIAVFQILVLIYFGLMVNSAGILFSPTRHQENRAVILFRLFCTVSVTMILLQTGLFWYLVDNANVGNVIASAFSIIALNSICIYSFTFYLLVHLGYAEFVLPVENLVGWAAVGGDDDDDGDDDDGGDGGDDAAAAAATTFYHDYSLQKLQTVASSCGDNSATYHDTLLRNYFLGQFPVVFFASMVAFVTGMRAYTPYLR